MFFDRNDKIKADRAALIEYARFLTDTSDKIALDADNLISAFCGMDWNDAVYSVVSTALDNHAQAMTKNLSQLDGSIENLNKLIDILDEYFDAASGL